MVMVRCFKNGTCKNYLVDRVAKWNIRILVFSQTNRKLSRAVTK